jgi:hypothetical protein
MIAERKTPASHHVPGAVDESQSNRAGTGYDDPAIASRKGTDTGGIGIIVGNCGSEWKVGRRNAVGGNRRDQPRDTESGM